MKNYKILSWMLSVAIIFSSVSPVQALSVSNSTGSVKEDITNETVIGQDTTQVQKSEYLDAVNGVNTTNIYATIASIFDVTIPKTLILDGQTKIGQYSVKIEGDIAGEETILVIPDETFAMKQSGKDNVTAIVSQDKTDWTYDQFDTMAVGTVTADGLTAGSWNGSFNFNISKNLMAGAQVPMSSVSILDENGTDLNGIGIVMDLNDPIIEELNNNNIVKALNITCDEFEGLATATIDVSDFAKDGELVAIYHYDEELNKWEYIDTVTVVNGQIEAEFDSFSPVAFEVVDHVHNYTESITKEATCVEEGIKTYTCGCGHDYEEDINALGHDYKSVVTAPTCEEVGYTTYTCNRCNDTYKDNEIEAAGHSYGSYTTTKEATCTEDGSKQRTCTTCENVDTAVVTKLGHDYATNYTIDKAATCTEAGSKSQHCSRCDSKQNITSIPATGHSNVNGGTSAIHTKCGVCGVTTSTAHSYTSSVAVAATCTAKGTTKYTCSCGYSYTSQNINALGHSYSNGKCIRCGITERINIVVNDVLQSGISRSIVSAYAAAPEDGHTITYPSNTSCVLYSDADEDDDNSACTMRFNRVIQGNGKKLYVQSQMIDYANGHVGRCVWKIQLVNTSTGAVTTLGQYHEADNYRESDGVYGNPEEFRAANNVLTAYTLPSSGTYYFQIRYFDESYGSGGRNVYCYLHNCYIDN